MLSELRTPKTPSWPAVPYLGNNVAPFCLASVFNHLCKEYEVEIKNSRHVQNKAQIILQISTVLYVCSEQEQHAAAAAWCLVIADLCNILHKNGEVSRSNFGLRKFKAQAHVCKHNTVQTIYLGCCGMQMCFQRVIAGPFFGCEKY